MSESAINAGIKSVLDGVSAIANVHDYVRWAKSWGAFLDLIKDETNGKINGWMFSRRSTATRQATVGEIERAHVYVVRGYYGLADADESEKTFQGIVDDACDAFDDDQTLGGACDTIHPDWGPMAGAVGLQVDIVEPRMFGSVLCHYFEGRLCALESVSD